MTVTIKNMDKSSIAGNWIFEYIKYFLTNSPSNLEQKTILKVEHMSMEFIGNIVARIEQRQGELPENISLILKTVQEVKGYEELALKEHETMVWLRNNIEQNQIVVLIVNEERPEGQSLKDIIAVNESILLADDGLKALRLFLEHKDILPVADINQLMKFIAYYQEITDMQLYTLVDFLAHILNSSLEDIHFKIADAYPQLQLFRTKNIDLKNKQKFIRELRKNLYLGSLRKSITQILNIETLMNSAEKFIINERETGYSSSFWMLYRNDEAALKQDIEDFLYRKNQNLLQIEYSEAEKLFNFKENRKLRDRLLVVNDIVQEKYDTLIKSAKKGDEKSRLESEKTAAETEILEAINAVDNKSDVEIIRDFREKYYAELDEVGVVKSLKSIESKLETPEVYGDLISAILSEFLVLIEGLENTEFENQISLQLKPRIVNCNQTLADKLNFHLKFLEAFNAHIEVEEIIADDTAHTMAEDIVFDIFLIVNNENGETIYSEKSFFVLDSTMLSMKNTSFYEFIEKIKNNEPLGYIEEKDGKPFHTTFAQQLDLAKKMANIEDASLKEHVQSFEVFLNNYQSLLEQITDGNFDASIFRELESMMQELFNQCYTNINAVSKIYECFNHIAAVHVINETQTIEQITLTIFHPMRLLGYMSKWIRLEKVMTEILDKQYVINRMGEIADTKKYREYLLAKLGDVPPAYIVGKSTNKFYFLESEQYGEAIYTMEASSGKTLEKADLFANEVQRVTKDYLSVYPFAKDSLNVLFMYVSNENYIIKSIDSILKNTSVEKINIAIYSKEHSSALYHRLSQWVKTREDLIVPLLHLGGLPKLEISIVPHDPERKIEDIVENTLSDYDLAFFLDFLTQTSDATIERDFFETEITKCDLTDHQWSMFEEVGYINSQGGSRHINYVSSELPEVLADFYNLQYMINKEACVKSDKAQLVKAKITTGNNEQNLLYEKMHDLFNWVVAYDKYIDPLIARQITRKAEIIKYSIVQKAQQDIKVLVSSSESVNRLLNETDNYYYHDRLANRLKDLLGIQMIDKEITQDMILKTKELSGASVLRSLGAGKFMHELLSIYLTLKNEVVIENDEIHIWSACDELEWFRNKSKRPDLLHTIIKADTKLREFTITLRLIELKLIHRQSYDQESKDARLQLDVGLETLQNYFDDLNLKLDKDNRLEAFYKHLMHNRPYTNEELIFMRQLRMGSDWKLNFEYEQQADIYIYSHDEKFVEKKEIVLGHYQECYGPKQICNIYTRSYILKELNVLQENAEVQLEAPPLTAFNEHLGRYADEFGIEADIDIAIDEAIGSDVDNTLSTIVEKDITEADEIINKLKEIEVEVEVEDITEPLIEVPIKNVVENQHTTYPEIEALANMQDSHEPLAKRMEQANVLANNYKVKLESGLRQNNINLTIKNSIIGANIIRFEGTIPVTETFNSIKSKENDMAIWLQIPDAPRVMNTGKIVIDVNRQSPDTIYFKEFMDFVRQQISENDIAEKAIVPIGLNPLNEVMYMDLNDTIAHILVAGTTGSGKSVSLNAIVLAMMCLYDEKQLRFTFIDPKQVEFSVYKHVRHTDKVLTGLEETAGYLDKITQLMDERYELLSQNGVRNIASYNRRQRKANKEEMSRLIIVFDEFADFMIQDKDIAKRIKDAIQRLGQKSRAAGIHLIICTQSPKADVIDTNTRNNLTGRICLRVSDSNASNVVIDEPGAELLAGKGDYLMRGNNNRLERGMSPYLDDETLDELLGYFEN